MLEWIETCSFASLEARLAEWLGGIDDDAERFGKIDYDKDNKPLLLLGRFTYFRFMTINAHRSLSASPCMILKGWLHEGVFQLWDIILVEKGPWGDVHISQGIGSALLSAAEEIAMTKGATSISGELAAVDYGHRDRQRHFYNKHGYTIVESGKEGKISKSLYVKDAQ